MSLLQKLILNKFLPPSLSEWVKNTVDFEADPKEE